ncbi:DUF4097 domain-containing protein [Algoriphagus sp. AGSA1]|uniref:DUF4097 family beta strand repeat-containing protein n=1 Tax=Algoriphagus sp. AGSA1 TaxID=2907213 RepID=UPI001F2D8C4A|nr:DUF4097 family beta strand repeat-containing protein [Algoriphagus sp. AGSA1]MCE7056078.1 DUF4097 domain-containing protein [Algoriphagus sp. AGSA1]
MSNNQFKIRSFLYVVLGAIVIGVTSCTTEMELVQSVDQEFSGISSLDIESAFLDVTYIGDPNKQEIHLVGNMESNRSGNYSIEYRVDGDKLIIEVEKRGMGTGKNRGFLNLSGPEFMNLDLEAGSGSILIQNVSSNEFEFEGGSGNVELNNISAPLIELELSSGKIQASNLVGNVDVEISSGNATISKLEGNINAVGSSGKFTFSEINGKVNSTLNSGNGDLNKVQDIGKLKTSSGNYTVKESYLGATTRLEGSSGNFDVQTSSNLQDFNFDLKSSSGNITVGESFSSGSLKINNGSPYTVSGVVSSGNIRIRN